MGKTRPILNGVVSEWSDGVTEYGMDDNRDGSLELYILAHQVRDDEIRREEDDDEIPLAESEFRLYDPAELSVDQHNALKGRGYHFHTVTERDLIEMLRAGFDGRSCRG